MTRYQKFVVAMLAFIQFTVVLDFMILSPLGAILMPQMHITPTQFGFVVSIYAFSAGIAGILAAGFADRFDRKRLLLFFYGGFILGTLFCALAPTYHFLLAARMVTGLFGGVMGSIVFAIATDLFAFEVRGRVMGMVQTAFAASQILGIPAGLYLANHWGWHMPFLMIVGISLLVALLIAAKLHPIAEHLKLRVDRKALHHLVDTLTNKQYVSAFMATALMATGGFMLMPFASAFSVSNLKISLEQLPLVYLITGLSAMVVGPLVGRLSDKIGKFKMFLVGSSMSVFFVWIYTHLGPTPVANFIVLNCLLFAGVFSRMIPAQALMSAIPAPASRGAFMAVSSSIQQISGGFASIIAGYIVVEGGDGTLQNFPILGYVIIGATLITGVLMYRIHLRIPEQSPKTSTV